MQQAGAGVGAGAGSAGADLASGYMEMSPIDSNA
jgi:hypothetical protein